MGLYLDNAATTPLSDEMISYLADKLRVFGNPSSSHSKGAYSNKLIEEVRAKTARFINAISPDCIHFTSSGSASNTLGIQGFALSNQCDILFPKTLHKSAIKTIENLSEYYNINTDVLKVDSYGNISIDCLERKMQTSHSLKLVVLGYANSEIGTIQNIREITKIVHRYGGKIFVDCTGAISTIPIDVTGLDVDMAAFSAHKIGALKGVGVLYKKEDIELTSLVYGSQEDGLFAGTENLLGILSLGKAIDLMRYSETNITLDNKDNRDFVWNRIKNIRGVYLVGAPIEQNRLPNNLYICIRGVNGGELVSMMDDVFHTQISTGSACNNGSPRPSPVLSAIGLNKEDMHSCIRISFSGNEEKKDLQRFCDNLLTSIRMLKNA